MSGTLTTQFTYDGLSNRTATTVDGVTTRYALDVAGRLPEVIVATTGGASTQYLQVAGQILTQYDSGTWAYVLPDHLGSVRAETDALGQVTVARDFDPFGVPLQADGGNPFGYTGEWWESQVELLYLRARWYEPGTGRFISKDPFPGYAYSPQSLNRWVYVRNNPVGLVDPSGLQEPVPVPTPGPPVVPEGTPAPPGGPQAAPTLPPGVPIPPQPAGTPTPSPEFAHYLEWTKEVGEHSDADLTDWLIREMRANVNGPIADFIRTNLWHWEDSPCGNPISGLTAYTLWYDAVKTHGLWDFKHRIYEVGRSIRLAGQWYRFDVPGNIFYGYMGVAIGFDEQILHCGAGFAAIRAGTGTTTDWRQVCKADAPEDREAVEAGFDLWKQARSNATGDALKAALAGGHPLIASAAPPPAPVHNPAWPYPVGYFNDGTSGWFFKWWPTNFEWPAIEGGKALKSV